MYIVENNIFQATDDHEINNPINILIKKHEKVQIMSQMPASSMLKSEVDLLNIIVQHKMPLNAFSSIMKLAKKWSIDYDHNFK